MGKRGGDGREILGQRLDPGGEKILNYRSVCRNRPALGLVCPPAFYLRDYFLRLLWEKARIWLEPVGEDAIIIDC